MKSLPLWYLHLIQKEKGHWTASVSPSHKTQINTAWSTLSRSLPLSLPPRNSAKWKAKPSLQENQTKAMCLEPSLCPDRHREFARANKFQSQRISAESSLQPVLLRPAPRFPASSCCSNRGKEASHYNDTFDSFAKSIWGGAKERSSVLSWKKQTLWGGILEILLVNLNGSLPTQRSTWAAIPRKRREQAPPGFFLSRMCPVLSGIQSICTEEWPSLSMQDIPGAEFQPGTLHLPLPQSGMLQSPVQQWAFTRPPRYLNASSKPGSSCSCVGSSTATKISQTTWKSTVIKMEMFLRGPIEFGQHHQGDLHCAEWPKKAIWLQSKYHPETPTLSKGTR